MRLLTGIQGEGAKFASVAGAFMYFATLTELRILEGLIHSGMGKGPALALLPAGKVQPRTRGLLGALVLGLLFGLVSAPSAAPILIVLLTYPAGSGASVTYGGLLLLVYALGHSLLIVIAGTSMGAARALIENKKMSRTMDILRKGAAR